MSRRLMFLTFVVGTMAAAFLLSAQERQRRWARYEPEMQDPIEDPPDAWVETEFVFARLRYRSIFDNRFRGRWGVDANKSDRLFMRGLRRLTRIETRSVEEIVEIESDKVYDFPWLYAVGAGDWRFTPDHANRLREYFERGGFLMVDDFHNDREWATFMEGIHAMFPEARVIEIPDDHPMFHTVYDLSDRVQISGFQIIRGMPYERGGVTPHWRAIVDEKDRVLVAICFNMDVGDAWEWSDYPPYPEKLASLAYRLGVNYATYALSH